MELSLDDLEGMDWCVKHDSQMTHLQYRGLPECLVSYGYRAGQEWLPNECDVRTDVVFRRKVF